MVAVYILYSRSINSFYVGMTQENLQERIAKHNSSFYGSKYTSKAKDWELYHHLECTTVSQALKIEKHIKAMKSRKYFSSLKNYPEVEVRLKLKYN